MSTATVTRQKVAWIREHGHPIGQPAPGRLGCPCHHAPFSDYHPGAPDLRCACGRVYTWDGWLKTEEVLP